MIKSGHMLLPDRVFFPSYSVKRISLSFLGISQCHTV